MTERSSPDTDSQRTFDTSGTILRRVGNVLTINCESGEVANRVADQLRTPARSSAGIATVSIKPMQLSDGRTDYFVSIKAGDREVTPHVFREEYKAAYHVALYDWLLNGSGEEPDVVEFGPDDWPARTFNVAQPSPGALQIDDAAKYLVHTIERKLWGGIRSDGRAKDAGFEPFHYSQHSFSVNGNARQEDYRDVVLEIARRLLLPSTQSESGSPVGWGGHLPGKIEP